MDAHPKAISSASASRPATLALVEFLLIAGIYVADWNHYVIPSKVPDLLPHKDIGEGLKWMRLSAEQGNQDAQLLLGKAYLQGELPREPVQAEMWLRLAARDNLDFYKNELRVAEGQMTPEQIALGKASAENWKPKHALRP